MWEISHRDIWIWPNFSIFLCEISYIFSSKEYIDKNVIYLWLELFHREVAFLSEYLPFKWLKNIGDKNGDIFSHILLDFSYAKMLKLQSCQESLRCMATGCLPRYSQARSSRHTAPNNLTDNDLRVHRDRRGRQQGSLLCVTPSLAPSSVQL